MTDLAGLEFDTLRSTIRSRGTIRPLAFLAGLCLWAAALIGVLIWLPTPLAAAVPLVMLLSTFEAVRALHLGVERIGRYLQVFFESRVPDAPLDPPAWERTAMLFGRSVPGTGVHPFFLPVFLIATLVNFFAVIFPGPIPLELAALSVPHVAFIVWMLYCDRGMRRQRASELARYRALKDANELRD